MNRRGPPSLTTGLFDAGTATGEAARDKVNLEMERTKVRRPGPFILTTT